MDCSVIESLPKEMKLSYEKAKKIVEKSEDIKIYSHTDCDGISAGAILSNTLDNLSKEHEIEIVSLDKLDDIELEHELTIFSDLGSGQMIEKTAKSSNNVIILDHHPPLRKKNAITNANEFLEINPMYWGIDGSNYVSGGGLSYFLAKEFGYTNLSWIGILSAVGDLQNSYNGKLEGLNTIIQKDSVNENYLKVIPDLSIYGRQTRPLYVALSYFSDVNLPITNNTNETIAMLKDLNIPRKDGDIYRTLSDLTEDEKGRLYSELIKMLSKEVPSKYIKYIPKLVGSDSYDLIREEKYTKLRDVSEFSSAMNACVRNKREDVALEILKGNRTTSLDEMENISKVHRTYLAKIISKVEDENLITPLKNIQYFNGDEIKTEVVGTVAGMILTQGDWRKPILGFSQVSEENTDIKVSLRCSRLLAYEGIHFGNIIRKIAKKVGGQGGGHSVACGAYIPENSQNKFIELFNNYLNH